MLTKHFLRRGYPKDIVTDAFDKALDTERGILLKPKETKQQKKDEKENLKTPMDVINKNLALLGTSNSRIIHRHRR